jgi:hypothetical protein
MTYRGDTSVPLAKLRELLDFIIENGDLKDPNTSIDPNVGAFTCRLKFDPSIWGKWFPSQDAALLVAATDKDVVGQHAGRSQGYTTHKTNWGGRVVNTPGKARSDFEQLPSAMDKYDVLMQGDITQRTRISKKTGKPETVEDGMLYRLAYSPSIGPLEDRKARLVALISGQAAPALPRRPQGERPEPCPKPGCRLTAGHPPPHKFGPEPPKAQPVPRVGQNLRPGAGGGDDDDVDAALSGLGGSAGDTSSFRSKMAKHNAEYQPSAKRKSDEPEDDQALFPKKRK